MLKFGKFPIVREDNVGTRDASMELSWNKLSGCRHRDRQTLLKVGSCGSKQENPIFGPRYKWSLFLFVIFLAGRQGPFGPLRRDHLVPRLVGGITIDHRQTSTKIWRD